MTSLSSLETLSNDLAIAAKTFADQCRDAGAGTSSHLPIAKNPSDETLSAKRNLLTTMARLQTQLAEPPEFIQHLAGQNQLLACLKWLGEFQVLACIPLGGIIPAKEVADLAGVPERQLCRVVRMTATAGFLHEPQPGHIAHTALSTPFVTNLSYFDAAMFLAETAVPTALHMATATQRHGDLEASSASAYNIAFNTWQTFQLACVERTRLQRQWAAYRRCAGGVDDTVTDILSRLNWRNLGNAIVVDACAQSTESAMALAESNPALHFIVQMSEPGPDSGVFGAGKAEELQQRITVQKRMPAANQEINDAALYILDLTRPIPSLSARMIAELNAHLGVLRANALSMLILAPPLLPEPGSVDPGVEAMARLRDLSHQQLSSQSGMELGEVIEMVSSVQDGRGSLVVVNKLRSRNSTTAALGVKYQLFTDAPFTAEPILMK